MVEVFKTNVQEATEADKLTQKLLEHSSDYSIHFDLEDCDKILRIEAGRVCPESIVSLLNNFGFMCQVLPD